MNRPSRRFRKPRCSARAEKRGARRHTAATYYAKYIEGGNASLSRLWRLQRLKRRDNREQA